MAVAHVQGNFSQTGLGSATIPVTLGATVGNADSLLGIAHCDDNGAGTFVSITDDKGNTYTIINQVASGRRAVIFCLGNITNAPITITANLNASIGNQAILVEEYSGTLASSNPIDNSGASHIAPIVATPGTGTDGLTSGNVTTVTNGCMIVGLSAHIAGFSSVATAGTGFTGRQQQFAGTSEDKAQSTAGAIAATFTSSVNDASVAALIALQPAGAGGTSPLRRNSSLDGLGASGGFFSNPLARSVLGWRPSIVTARRKLIVPRHAELRLAA